VTVRDTGMGIEADLRPRIFEMFSQAGHVRDTSGGGLGIGLALAQRLVEMHDGTIDVQSQGPGHGSEFIVHLPVTAVPHATESTRPQLSREMDGLVRRRVLVADDNADAADTLAMFLEDLGCDVRTVYDGNEAVVEAERFRPELMLLDLGMPGLNGQAVCHRVRGERWGADAVIVAITGWGQEADRRRTKIAGFDYHLVKPVEPDVLVQLVRSKHREVTGLR
jgi:CheY-like chemotaxis protein